MISLSAIPQAWRKPLLYGTAAVAACVAAFFAGKYSAPKPEAEIKWREIRSYTTEWIATTDTTDRTKIRTRIVTVEKVQPDGARETTRTEETGTDVAIDSHTSTAGQEQGSTTTEGTAVVHETSRPGWALGVGALWDPGRLSRQPERMTLELDRRLAGSVWLGLRASAEPDLGAPRVGAALRMEW